MKKLTTLIALALVLTIGGVYAAWTYFQGGANGAIAHPRIGMATISYNGEKGTITADTTGITLLVDDMSTVENSGVTTQHTAGLTGKGEITVTFSPKQGADQVVVDDGIYMKAIITVVSLKQPGTLYNGETPLSTKADTTKTEFIITLDQNQNPVRAQTATITCNQIINALVLNGGETLTLSTKAEYEAFAAALSDYQIHVEIVEYTPPAAA